jgi:hypothetical protein
LVDLPLKGSLHCGIIDAHNDDSDSPFKKLAVVSRTRKRHIVFMQGIATVHTFLLTIAAAILAYL